MESLDKIVPIQFNEEVDALLSGEHLPVSDLRNSSKTTLFGVCEGSRIVGVVGIEVYDRVGLIRSLVVDKTARGSGYGRKLVAKAEKWSDEQGIQTLYLLTTTAAGFFSRIGYEVADRSEAPNSIAGTAQFADLCPSSAVFMCKRTS